MLFTSVIAILLLLARIFGEPLIRQYAPENFDRIEHFITIALIVCVAIVIDRLGRRFYWQGHVKRRRGRETPRLVQDLVTILIIALGVAVGLWWQEGLTLTGIAATSIGIAAAIGVALQPDIQDVFSGLSMNYEDTCAIGDWITIQLPDQDSVTGCVSELSWRSTFLTQGDGCRVSIPNHFFTTNPVFNHSRPPGAKRIAVEIGVDSRVPSERVIDMLKGEALKAQHRPGLSRAHEPEVLLKAITSDASTYTVHFWHFPGQISPAAARSIVLLALQKALLGNGVPMPVTQIEMTQAPDVEFLLGPEEIREGIRRADLFRNALDDDLRDRLAARCKAHEIRRGTILMRRGGPAGSMFILLEGAVGVTIRTATGSEEEVAISATGDVVGEMSLMTGSTRVATVTALTHLRVLEIDKDAIEDLLRTTPELFERFSQVLAERQLQNQKAANRKEDVAEVQLDIMAKMKAFFSRALRGRQSE
jgi:branched-chain amino acid transport system substrate-binding protein